MANKKISELVPASLPLDGTELAELSQLSGGVYGSVHTPSANLAYAGMRLGAFYDVTDQTGSTSAATAVKIGSNQISTKGVTIVSSGGNPTRITYSTAGTYMIAPSLQFANSDSTDRAVTVWFAKNGTDIANSATKLTVPKAADGGAAFFQIVYYETLAAGDYLEVRWLPESITVTLDHIAAGAIAPAVPSVVLVTERIDA